MAKDTQPVPSLRIEELLLVSSSFAHSQDFLARDRREPLGDMAIDAQFQLAKGLAPSVVGVSVRVGSKPGTDSAYSFHAEMLAVIRLEEGAAAPPADKQLLHAGVTILFPFVRETIANMTMRGRFGPMWIKPINVQAMIESSPNTVEAKARATGKKSAKKKSLVQRSKK